MKNASGIISPNTYGRLPIFDLIAEGKLGEYLCWEWKRVNGWDPRFLKKFVSLKSFFEYTLGVISLLCFGTIGQCLAHDGHWTVFGVAAIILALCVCGFFAIALYFHDIEQHVYDFERAVSWLLRVVPMDKSTFPKDIDELRVIYGICMVDMAKFVLSLEGSLGFWSIKSAAKTTLHCLLDGAKGFGFVRDTKIGLRIYFDQAKNLKRFVMFDEADWVERHHEWLKRIMTNRQS